MKPADICQATTHLAATFAACALLLLLNSCHQIPTAAAFHSADGSSDEESTTDDAASNVDVSVGPADGGATDDAGDSIASDDAPDMTTMDVPVINCNPADCEDGNACTTDGCGAAGCTHTVNTGPCDDANACTAKDACSVGSCKGVLIDADGDGAPPTSCGGSDCNDENKDIHVGAPELCDNLDNDCNGKTDDLSGQSICFNSNEFGKCQGVLKSCVNGVAQCDGKAAQPEACNGIDDNCDGKTDEGLCEDGDPCTKDTCNTDGSCQHVQLGGMPCDDGSVCTQTDKCLSGKCVGGNQMNCDDNLQCTVDSCDPFAGCVHVSAADDTGCSNDGNQCTLDVCKAGTCTHPPAIGGPCADDGVACTLDQCDSNATCQHPLSSGPCEDGNPCTEGDSCVNGACKSGPLKGASACDDGNPCTTDKCDPNQVGGCTHENKDFATCVSPSPKCPTGQCAAGVCYPQANVTCMTTVKSSICTSDPIAGVCTAAGECVITKAPSQYTCPGCNGICQNCAPFGQICTPY